LYETKHVYIDQDQGNQQILTLPKPSYLTKKKYTQVCRNVSSLIHNNYKLTFYYNEIIH